MSFARRRELEHLLVHPAWLPVERPVHGVTERRVDEPAEREPEHPRVVVDDVELVGLEERVHGVLHLPVRVPDPLARRGVEDGLEPRARLRVARGEERDLVARVDEPVGQERDHAFGSAVRLRRHRKPNGADKADSHTPSAIVTWPRSTATVHVRPYARTPSIRRPSSQLGSSSVTVETSRCRSRSGSMPRRTRTSRIGRARGPGLRPRGGRIRDRKGRLLARIAGEDLRQRPVEVSRGLDQRSPDTSRLGDVAVAREPQAASDVSCGQTVPLW